MRAKVSVKKKEVPNFVPKSTGRIVDAGGGAGRDGLTYEQLKKGQDAMFQRSLNLSYLSQLDKEQSIRQTTLVEQPRTVRVMVAREDYLEVEAPFVVTFLPSTSQASWAKFIIDVSEKLKINFLEVIVDRKDFIQIHCTLSLREGGYYLARQRESSAVMDTISTGKNPTQVYWQITRNITAVKADLIENLATKDDLDKRSVELIQKPIVCKLERETYNKLLDCTYSDNIVQTIRDAIDIANGSDPSKKISLSALSAASKKASEPSPSETAQTSVRISQPDDPPGFEFKPLIFNENELDVVNLVRLGYEALSRVVFKGQWAAKEIATHASEFIFTNLMKYIAEVDIVVLGLKLINDIISELNSAKFVIFKVCLDAIEFYAPPAPPHRPRPIPRSREIVNQLAASILELMSSKEKESTEGNQDAEDQSKGENSSKQVEKDGRGRAGLAKPNIKDLLTEKQRVHTVEETIDVQSILSKHSSTLPIITSRPSSKSGRQSAVSVDTAINEQPSPSVSFLPAAFAVDEEQEVIEEQVDGFRKVRSISKGHVLSKKDWKGASGKIGKKYVDESSLEFQMKLMADKGELGGDEIMKAVADARSKRVKRPKAIIRPRMFRGFTGNMKNNMALLQAFVTLFYLVTRSPKNKEFAFHIHLQDEISHIAVVCQAFPQVLEYIMWIIDAMYKERVVLDDFEEDLLSDPYSMQLSRDSLLSKSRTSSDILSYRNRRSHHHGIAYASQSRAEEDEPDDLSDVTGNNSLPLLTGMEWEIMSDITVPTVATLETQFSTDIYMEGDAEIEETEQMKFVRLKTAEKERDADADAPDFEGGTASIVLEDKKQIAKRMGNPGGLTEKEQRKAERAAIRAQRAQEVKGSNPSSAGNSAVNSARRPGSGHGEPVSRLAGPPQFAAQKSDGHEQQPFLAQPSEIVIVAVAMIGSHVEIATKEKQLSARWLALWDDGTQEYQLKVRLGMSLSSA